MQHAFAARAALASFAVLVGCCGNSHDATSLPGLTTTKVSRLKAIEATSLPGLTAPKIARLKAIVQAAATAGGDAHPSSVMVFASRRHEANIAAGAGSGVPGTQPVYLVVLRGHFICNACSGPPNAAPPRGNVITIVLDRRTLHGLDGGIGGRVDTSKLGPGLPLRLGQP